MISTIQRAGSGVLAVLILTMLPACFSLGRSAPAPEHYVVGGSGPPDNLGAAGLDGVTVGLRRIDLAPYLATSAIVVRRGEHEVLTSAFHQWSESPADGIGRAVARFLSTGAPFRAVDVAPWPVRTRYDYLIQLHVTRFEGTVPAGPSPAPGGTPEAMQGSAHVRASWEIIRQQDETVLARGDTEYRADGWAPGDYAALVALLDEGLVVLTRDVAMAMAGLADENRP